MLTAGGIESRRRRFWGQVPGDCDLVVFSTPEALALLCGFWANPFSFRANEAAAALLLARDHALLIGDNLLGPDLDRAFVDEVRAPRHYDGSAPAGDRRRGLWLEVSRAIREARPRRMGVDTASLPLATLEEIAERFPPSIGDVSRALLTVRRRKEPDEVALLKRCLAASDAAFAAALEDVRPGMTELNAYEIVARAATAAAGEPAWVYGDFVAGRDGARRGGPPTARRIEPGDLLLLDFSVVLHGYRGDCANTFLPGGGTPKPHENAAFRLCLEAIAAGEAALRPGVAARGVDAAVRAALRGHEAIGGFSGHVGHGLGTGHPEAPFLVPGSDEVLAPGDVVTLEPGLYRPGSLAMRYERNYLVTNDGFDTLSGHRLTITS
jgi:Xaa-Pro aminopeptidase